VYKDKKIAVVVPCYNEETQIPQVIKTMPDYIDLIVMIDDNSTDKTVDIIKSYSKTNEKIILIIHDSNRGVGGSIETGYIWARDNGVDVAVVMAGDGQMDPKDLPKILAPVVNGEVDYSKGNRLFTGEAFKKIPKVRYFGNSILSFLTKIASGYWHIADSQCGYTAINRKALEMVNWKDMYKRYGQPNHLLVMLNILNFRVRDIPVNPVYGIGESSGIKLRSVVPRISYLLIKNFLWRMKEKYVIRDFHPLILFYLLGIFFGLLTVLLFGRLFFFFWIKGLDFPPLNAFAMMFSFMSSSLFILFAMWFDMEANKHLR
jgi:glycosyltransferase involved in cell wall biosynthesis